MSLKNHTKYLIAFAIMLVAAFIQCYRTIHDLHWAFEPDFDRDIAYIRATLNGEYGTDPNMAGQYMWYNPMIFLFETLVVKLSGFPINVVVARAGAFLNIINPIVFFIVMVKLFDYRIALAAILSYLFLSVGNLPCWGAPTYSPWLISDTFVQFLFFINIFFCYRAFSTQKISWFIILGAGLGVSFLGHSAPTILVILILIALQAQNVFIALKDKRYPAIGTYFLQGILTLIPFIIFAFPFLYYVYGKYHLHFINRTILECAPGIFARKDSLTLLKLNLTFSLLIAAFGFYVFYKNFQNVVLRRIIWAWLLIAAIMYVYESVLPTLDKITHFSLFDTIPAFHYFFYLKALQSVFFAFGFLDLFGRFIAAIGRYTKLKFSANRTETILVLFTLVYMIVYYPIYVKRTDFAEPREQALQKEKESDKLGVYDFIVNKVPLSDVLLCEHGLSLFPVMPTGIKMVSIETYFSNPYVSYDQREDDRNAMLSYLTTGEPSSAKKLFNDYKVNVVLLENKDFEQYKKPSFAKSDVIFKNNGYTIISLTDKK